MTPQDFDELKDDILTQCNLTLSQKADEYSDGDRLSNFKKAAALSGGTPAQALMGFRLKHEIALNDYVRWLSEGKAVPMPWIREKIVDLINYNILLLALIAEKRSK
jgi:hypothetical protein